MCDATDSYGFHWRRVNRIKKIKASKRTGSMLTGSAMKYQEKYDRVDFQKHLKLKKACIYHGITQGFEEMEKWLEDTYGIIVTIYFKSNNISYLEMYSFISHQAGTFPKLLTVGGNCNME